MANPINAACASVTAMYKFYHTDPSDFYPSATAATEQKDEFYAVTQITGDTASQCIIRFVKDENSSWVSYILRDEKDTATSSPTLTAVGSISGTDSGMFARMLGKTYYTNGQDYIRQIRARTSAGDDRAKFLYIAGVPDPNPYKQFSNLDNTGEVTVFTAGAGAGSCVVTYSVQHRREGTGAIIISQDTANCTSAVTFVKTAAQDWTVFNDGTVCSGSDYVAMEIYRFNKQFINQIQIRCGYYNTATHDIDSDYFDAYLTVTGEETNSEGETVRAWHPVQNTMQARWANNPYDNQMFRVRIRKDFFGKTGSADWSNIEAVQVRMYSGKAASSRQAKIAIDNIRILKSPPVVKSNRIQCATFERQEDYASQGWLTDTGAGTKAEFSHQFAREGMCCLKVCAGETCTLTFTANQDFTVFPDGTTADRSCVLRCNVSWNPVGYVATATATWWSTSFTCPRIKFVDSSGKCAETTMFTLGHLNGGGVVKQVLMKFEDGSTGSWTQEAGFDWTSINKIRVSGPSHANQACKPYYFDDLRIERPMDAQQPVFLFEPIEAYVIDTVTELLGSVYKDFSWVIDFAGEGLKLLFGSIQRQTYGWGWLTYPDYEHSSLGVAGCTLHAYGSKAFGVRFKYSSNHDLANYKIPTNLFPPEFSTTDFSKIGDNYWTEIPANESDEMSIWIACEKEEIKNIEKIVVRIFGANGTSLDTENYAEYTITAEEINKVQTEQGPAQKKFQENYEALQKAFKDNPADTLSKLGSAMRAEDGELEDFIKEGIRSVGRDRGGWNYGTFTWKRSDMIIVENTGTREFSWSSVRGVGIEVTPRAGGCSVCFDNFIMRKQGNLEGKYYYRVMLADPDGNLSPASEMSFPAHLHNEDAYLTNIYVPTGPNKHRVQDKLIFRLGGTSTEWRQCGNCAVSNDKFFDPRPDDKLGKVMPDDAYAPPRCKVMKAIGNTMYYANITNDRLNEKFPYRMFKSKPFVPFRVGDFDAIDIPEDKGNGIVAIEEWYNQIVIWTPETMWSIPVGFKGVPQLRSNKGCIARDSVAKSDYGLIWLSKEGLMIGNISKVDDNFFKPVNSLFDDYSEDDLDDAIGFVQGQYYYLFYNFDHSTEHQGTGNGICCYLPERTFSELEGPFDVRSICRWDGGEDTDEIYYGRSDGTIWKMFSGTDDNGTAITTTLRTREFSQPGIQYDKWLRAFYLAFGNIQTTDNSTITPSVYVNETSKETMPIWTATTTTMKTFCQPAVQGDEGTHISIGLSGSGRHKITQMVVKVEVEEDVERKV